VQAESHSIFPSGNGCPHFQHVFIRGSFLFVYEIPIPQTGVKSSRSGSGTTGAPEKSDRVRCFDPLRLGWRESQLSRLARGF
jgi:hypothetical protein